MPLIITFLAVFDNIYKLSCSHYLIFPTSSYFLSRRFKYYCLNRVFKKLQGNTYQSRQGWRHALHFRIFWTAYYTTLTWHTFFTFNISDLSLLIQFESSSIPVAASKLSYPGKGFFLFSHVRLVTWIRSGLTHKNDSLNYILFNYFPQEVWPCTWSQCSSTHSSQ
jgi:hypothetical protein